MFVIEGHGYGHGVGLSQYGAEGLTRHGYSYREVLAHYYPGTSLARVPQSARIRVLIATGYRSVSVASTGSISFRDGAGATAELGPGAYTVSPTLIAKGGRALSPRPPVRLEPTSSALRLNGRAFRGSLVVLPDGSGLTVINDLPIDLYVRGVVAREMPSNWNREALRAQAVAARSYALASLRPSRSFDVYPDQRSQMYGGLTAEARATNAAVVGTAGEVLVWQGRVASTYFNSSSGGRTARSSDAWPGGRAMPYLASVPDPYDALSPQHHWGPYFLSATTLSARLGLPTIYAIRTTLNTSGRVATVEISTANGPRTLTGNAVASALGLRSTWFSIRRNRFHVAATSTPPSGAAHTTFASTDTPAQPQVSRTASPAAREDPRALRDDWVAIAFACTLLVLLYRRRRLSALPLSQMERAPLRYFTARLSALAAVSALAIVFALEIDHRGILTAGGRRPERETIEPHGPPTQRPTRKTLPDATAPALPSIPKPTPPTTTLSWATTNPVVPHSAGPIAEGARRGTLAGSRESAPRWTLQPQDAPKAPAPLEIRDVQIRSVTSSSAVLTWSTNLPAVTQGARSFSSTPRIWTVIAPSSLEHQTQLEGLGGSVPYHVWLFARDEYGQTASTDLIVVTQPAPELQATIDRDTILVNREPTFPLMVWAACTSDVAAKLTQGINLFMGNGCGPDRDLTDALDGRALTVVNAASAGEESPGIIGWYYPDEWDAHLQSAVTREDLAKDIPAPQPGRISFLTLTNHFYSRANPLPQGKGMYPTLMSIPDSIGFDLYPLQVWCRPAFGDVMDAQSELGDTSGKPSFQWIEVAPMEHQCKEQKQLDPTPETVRAETWLAIAGGADGIGYFPNVWSAEIGDVIAQSNWQIKELAPALLAPDWEASSETTGLRVAARQLNGALYIIAVNTNDRAVSAVIHVPKLGARTTEVVGETRSVTAQADSFSDQFAPLDVHVYVAPPEGWTTPPPDTSTAEDPNSDPSPFPFDLIAPLFLR
jgi:stage II sporulation protein D